MFNLDLTKKFQQLHSLEEIARVMFCYRKPGVCDYFNSLRFEPLFKIKEQVDMKVSCYDPVEYAICEKLSNLRTVRVACCKSRGAIGILIVGIKYPNFSTEWLHKNHIEGEAPIIPWFGNPMDMRSSKFEDFYHSLWDIETPIKLTI